MDASALEARIFAPRQVVGWVAFTFAAGFINAGAVLSCNNVVTHITGNVTSIGLDNSLTRVVLLISAAFIAGAMVAVLFRETLSHAGDIGAILPLLASFLILMGISVGGRAGALGQFGSSELGPRGSLMLALLAVAMGMVNASIAAATANKIRITHLTGPATDLAGNLVRAALGTGDGSRAELRWAALRLAKLVSFAFGAALAARVAPHLQFDMFGAAGGILIVAIGLSGAPASGDEPEAPVDDTVVREANAARCEDGAPLFPPPKRDDDARS